MAPLDERIAYMSQWLRLPLEEAAEMVRVRAPDGCSHFYDRDGNAHMIRADGCVMLNSEESAPLLHRGLGWEIVEGEITA